MPKIVNTDQTATVEREYSNLYKVEELTFPLSDDTESVKQVVAWGKSPQHCTDTISENASITEQGRRFTTYTRNFEEGIALLEDFTKDVFLIKNEALLVGENKHWELETRINEDVKIADVFSKRMKHNFSEEVFVTEEYVKKTKKPLTEAITLSEDFQRQWKSTRVYEESLSLSEGYKKKIAAYKYEEVCIKDARIRPTTNGVLSNISFSEGEEQYEDFKTTADKVAGYTPFIEFKVGDYEYQAAIYRMVMTRNNLNANSLFYDYAVHVDIPDTFDRGESAVNGETKIYFNKHYYHAPEVNVTVTGGTGILIPRIITLNGKDDDGRYFSVILETADGESKAGRVSWSARGY